MNYIESFEKKIQNILQHNTMSSNKETDLRKQSYNYRVNYTMCNDSTPTIPWPVHEALTNHNHVLANSIGNVMKEAFFAASVDQVGPSYFNGYNPSTVGSSVLSSSSIGCFRIG